MNPNLERLQSYSFQKLSALLDGAKPDPRRKPIALHIGEPKHPTPEFIKQALADHLDGLASYPPTLGGEALRAAIYFDEARPPLGALQAAQRLGRKGWPRLVVFSSLSKRSNVPGMRSGFVAGDAAILKKFLLYRTYHGCAMSPPIHAASVAAWKDEAHGARGSTREPTASGSRWWPPLVNASRPPGASAPLSNPYAPNSTSLSATG